MDNNEREHLLSSGDSGCYSTTVNYPSVNNYNNYQAVNIINPGIFLLFLTVL